MSLSQYGIMYLRKCASREDTGQPANSHSLITAFMLSVDGQGYKVASDG